MEFLNIFGVFLAERKGTTFAFQLSGSGTEWDKIIPLKAFMQSGSRDQHPKRLGGVVLVEEFFEMLFQYTAEILPAVQWSWKVNWEVSD